MLIRSFLLSLALLVSFASPASAALMIDVSGTPGLGTSTWALSGSAVAVNPAPTEGFDTGTPDSGVNWWNGFTASGVWSVAFNSNVTSGDAVIEIDGTPYGVTNVRAATLGVGQLLGLGIDNATEVLLSNGDLVGFSGNLVVAIDINDISSFTSSEHGGLELIFTVPEPASASLLGAAGLALLRHR